jgi:acyl dehydratase
MGPATTDLYRLASDLAAEHGADACDAAGRAAMTLEAEGNHTMAQFRFVMPVLPGGVVSLRSIHAASPSIESGSIRGRMR